MAKSQIKTDLMKALAARLGEKPYRRAPLLVLGVSGGKDSMVLLDVFWRMRHVHQSPLKVVHVDHHTGSHTQLARDLVIEVCQTHHLELTVMDFHWDERGNFEHAASQFRRQALKNASAGNGYAVLAHHQRDQAETLVMALTRGAGITSPLGMFPEKDRRLRPFLDLSPALIHDHAKAVGLPWHEDPTNAEIELFRNGVRHQVLPFLEGFHAEVGARMGGWIEEFHHLQAHLFEEANRIWQAEAEFAGGLHGWCSRAMFAQHPPFLWPFLLARFWDILSLAKPKRTEHQQILKWLEQGKTGCFDHAGKRFYCDLDGLALVPKPEAKPVPAKFGESTTFGLWSLRIEKAKGEWQWNSHPGAHAFQWIAGLPLPKSMRERLRQAGIPLRVRHHLPGLVSGTTTLHFGELLALQKRGDVHLVRESGPAWEC